MKLYKYTLKNRDSFYTPGYVVADDAEDALRKIRHTIDEFMCDKTEVDTLELLSDEEEGPVLIT